MDDSRRQADPLLRFPNNHSPQQQKMTSRSATAAAAMASIIGFFSRPRMGDGRFGGGVSYTR